MYTNQQGSYESFFDSDSGYYLNYTQVMSLSDEEYNLAPRMVFSDAAIMDSEYKATVILMDTERESDIGLGPDYPFDPLGAGECIVSDEYSENFGIGETITVFFDGF